MADQYRITRAHGTECAFCGLFHDNGERDVYAWIGCGLPLFRSNAKFDSGTGWPSFFQPVAAENIGTERDMSHGMIRTEIHCVRCNSHLGHAFNDDPEPTGLRYCINSAALLLHEDGLRPARERVLFGAGCFWGIEEMFRKVKGVAATRAGYAGGHTQNPTYEDVCSHTTGHTEVVEVEFDPAQISLRPARGILVEPRADASAPHGPRRRQPVSRGGAALVRQTIFELLPSGAEKQKPRGGCEDRPVCRV
jgi:peptide methionine sulfoxide reductase msrA/msrB